MDSVFQTTGQALHVSYLIMSVEARQKSPLRQALIQIIEAIESPSARLKAWLEQLRGESSGTVNFGGLDAYDVRAQCAMVTQAVIDHLPEPERNVIQARFIPTATEEIGRDSEGQPQYRFYFSRERVEAMQRLSIRLAPNFRDLTIFQLDHLVAKAFAERREVRNSFRDLAALAGGSHMLYARKYPAIVAHLSELEAQAMRRLTHHFERTGLIEIAQQTA